MTKEEVILHFGRPTDVAKVLSITKGAVSSWGHEPPRGIQFELEVLTNGALRATREKSDRPRKQKAPSQQALTTSAC